jgi:hypothetical protein
MKEELILKLKICIADNPILHPPIVILNTARIEHEGDKMLFYKDGVTPTVAKVIGMEISLKSHKDSIILTVFNCLSKT